MHLMKITIFIVLLSTLPVVKSMELAPAVVGFDESNGNEEHYKVNEAIENKVRAIITPLQEDLIKAWKDGDETKHIASTIKYHQTILFLEDYIKEAFFWQKCDEQLCQTDDTLNEEEAELLERVRKAINLNKSEINKVFNNNYKSSVETVMQFWKSGVYEKVDKTPEALAAYEDAMCKHKSACKEITDALPEDSCLIM